MRKVEGYISSRAGKRLEKVEKEIKFEQGKYVENEMINIFPERRYQEILGFGGAFTEASAYNYARMDDEKKEKVLKAFFDKEEGLGYNFCRTHIHSCDFSLEQYTYIEENDTELKTFSIEQDQKYTIPFIQAALETSEGMILFASPWSPPAWMKSNGDMCRGGRLLDKYYGIWADYMVRYIKEYEKEGITFTAITVENEPGMPQAWESCVYTAREEAEFVHQYLRPALDRAGYQNIKIMIWDFNKEFLYERVRDSFHVPGVKDDVWGIAYHWYAGDHFAEMDMVHELYGDKPMILTEAGLGGARGEARRGAYSTWENAEIYSRELIGGFQHYMSAAVEWNLILDENGGPYHDRPMGGCKAPIIYNHETGELGIQPVYYATAQFSRFIKRGAVRLGTSTFNEEMKAAAFENPDGTVILVILNCMENPYEVFVRLEDTIAEIFVPEKSVSTYVVSKDESIKVG
ncbi:MAG: glucosylceramidase [Faecalicatena sp.]|uniref:glycoside hydrolase family 30 protein n=1 Tax=Faecalicatena sp. TaxID=2005360 RepID=UPI00258869DA|nr:glycoside hydrolase family 30 protein [Faecalicatena sp.]MCI6467795.1 glucosylceramidase [Faecalicatena sp.]MDY5619563.1 glycoside hydrolase family 30 protein [Lachnospiraceae bacterium]